MPKFQKSDGFKMKRGSKPTFKHLGSSKSSPKPGDSPVEAWDWSSAGGGAAQGAMAGAALGPWGAVAGGVICGVAGGLMGGAAANRAADAEALQQDSREVAATTKARETVKQARETGSGYGESTNVDRLGREKKKVPVSSGPQLGQLQESNLLAGLQNGGPA